MIHQEKRRFPLVDGPEDGTSTTVDRAYLVFGDLSNPNAKVMERMVYRRDGDRYVFEPAP